MGRFVTPDHQEFDSNGDPLSGGKLHFYATGTLVAKDTFSDDALTTANANPVVADAAGRFGDIFLESGDYRVILKDSDDVTIKDSDPVSGSVGTSGTVDEKTTDYTVTLSDSTKLLNFDATSGAITVTMLAAATAGDGFEVTIKKSDSSANAVTIDGNASETIDGAATFELSNQYDTVTIRSDASGWLVVNRRLAPMTTAEAEAGTAIVDRVITPAVLKAAIVALAPAVPTYSVNDLLLSGATDTLSITAGDCWDATLAEQMALAAFTKNVSTAWAVGTGNGSLDTGSYTATTLYYVWLIKRSDTDVVDVLTSESGTAPTMPTNYDFKRLIGAFVTDSGPDIIAFTQVGDYFRFTGAVVVDVSDSTITDDTFEDGILSVPRHCLAHIYAATSNPSDTTGIATIYIKTKGAGDTAAFARSFMAVQTDSATDVLGIVGAGTVLVDASSTIEYAADETTGAVTITITTFGFTMLTRSNPL